MFKLITTAHFSTRAAMVISTATVAGLASSTHKCSSSTCRTLAVDALKLRPSPTFSGPFPKTDPSYMPRIDEPPPQTEKDVLRLQLQKSLASFEKKQKELLEKEKELRLQAEIESEQREEKKLKSNLERPHEALKSLRSELKREGLKIEEDVSNYNLNAKVSNRMARARTAPYYESQKNNYQYAFGPVKDHLEHSKLLNVQNVRTLRSLPLLGSEGSTGIKLLSFLKQNDIMEASESRKYMEALLTLMFLDDVAFDTMAGPDHAAVLFAMLPLDTRLLVKKILTVVDIEYPIFGRYAVNDPKIDGKDEYIILSEQK